jgi:hypothetical protein
MCNYDLDDLDIRWLAIVNGERSLMGELDNQSTGSGQGKLTALLSTNVTVLSAFRHFRTLPACW